jgi:hypothetical protein
MLLGLFYLLPLLEAVCDFVATIKICEVNLYMMYLIPSNNINANISKEHFQVLSNVVENSSTTIM